MAERQDPNYMSWKKGDLTPVPEAETSIVEMHLGPAKITVRMGVVESSDEELVALGKEILEEYVPQYGDASMWVANAMVEITDAVIDKVYLPSEAGPVE